MLAKDALNMLIISMLLLHYLNGTILVHVHYLNNGSAVKFSAQLGLRFIELNVYDSMDQAASS